MRPGYSLAGSRHTGGGAEDPRHKPPARPRSRRGPAAHADLTLLLLAALIIVGLGSVIIGTLGMTREASPGADQTASLRATAAAWVQAELEYATQLGYQGLCDASTPGFPTCVLYVPSTTCTGRVSQTSPLSQGPPQPPEFPYGRIAISWDPHSPVDSTMIPPIPYLQLVEVDAYRTRADCTAGRAFFSGYTTVAIR